MKEAFLVDKRINIFEKMPVWKAVLSLAIPSILSMLVTMIYNLADTFYIGQTGDPDQVAAVTIAFAGFMVLNALGNLFGIGGGSLISRLLGEKKDSDAKSVSVYSIVGGIVTSALYSVFLLFFMDPVIKLLGGTDLTAGYAYDYLYWTVVIGGVPTSLGIVMGHLLRSEGRAKLSSVGIALGGFLNIILDPIFIFTLDMNVAGAALATMISNGIALLYYILVFYLIRKKSVLSLNPKHFKMTMKTTVQVFAVGLPAATATVLAIVANSALFNLFSNYGSVPVAAMGIVKKIDSIPFNIAMGLAQGILPLVAYNYAAKNFDRMKAISSFSWIVAAGFAVLSIVVFELFPSALMRLFIPDEETISTGIRFLRVACLGMPSMVLFFLMNTTFQAMGKGVQSLVLVFCRQLFFNLPLLFLLNHFIGMDGLTWTQPIADTLAFILAFVLFEFTVNQLKSEQLNQARLQETIA